MNVEGPAGRSKGASRLTLSDAHKYILLAALYIVEKKGEGVGDVSVPTLSAAGVSQ